MGYSKTQKLISGGHHTLNTALNNLPLQLRPRHAGGSWALLGDSKRSMGYTFPPCHEEVAVQPDYFGRNVPSTNCHTLCRRQLGKVPKEPLSRQQPRDTGPLHEQGCVLCKNLGGAPICTLSWTTGGYLFNRLQHSVIAYGF